MPQATPLDADLLISPGCAICPGVIEALTQLIERGELSSLHIYNLRDYPEKAVEAGTRSVPWIRIGEFEFTGGHTLDELTHWVRMARQPDGRKAYLLHLLDHNQLPKVTELAHGPDWLAALLAISADLEAPMAARIGASAAIEQLAGGEALRSQVGKLIEMSHSDDRQTRADAAYFLGLVGGGQATERLRALLQDEDPEVREIAREALGSTAE